MNIPLGRTTLTGLWPWECQRLALGLSWRWDGEHYALLLALGYIMTLSEPKPRHRAQGFQPIPIDVLPAPTFRVGRVSVTIVPPSVIKRVAFGIGYRWVGNGAIHLACIYHATITW